MSDTLVLEPVTKHPRGGSYNRPLTLKQQRFITEYIKTGNATDAVRKAGYESKRQPLTDQTAGVIAFENLKKPKIMNVITKELTKQEVSAEWILYQIRDIAIGAHDAKVSDRLKALELIGKHLKMFGDTQQIQYNDITVNFGQPTKIVEGLVEP